jgi:hypothetical protein
MNTNGAAGNGGRQPGEPPAPPELPRFELAGGSVAGGDHRRAGRGSQDAMAWARSRWALVAVVCDGCSGGRHSEVGAGLGARLAVTALLGRLAAGERPDQPTLWRRLRADLLARLDGLARAMGEPRAEVVADHFLFTLVGAAVTPAWTAVFAAGDGLYAVNGETCRLGPFADNRPPYLGADLLGGGVATPIERCALRPTAEVDTLLVGTDGVNDVDSASAAALPGGAGEVGPLAQFWRDDLFFRNPDAVRRRLAVIGREVVGADWDRRRLRRSGGLLRDDTTLIAIRRAAGGEGERWPA